MQHQDRRQPTPRLRPLKPRSPYKSETSSTSKSAIGWIASLSRLSTAVLYRDPFLCQPIQPHNPEWTAIIAMPIPLLQLQLCLDEGQPLRANLLDTRSVGSHKRCSRRVHYRLIWLYNQSSSLLSPFKHQLLCSLMNCSTPRSIYARTLSSDLKSLPPSRVR